MVKTDVSIEATDTGASGRGRATAGVVFGALGVFTAVWMYWLLVPGVVFGIAALVLGVRARQGSFREAGSVAIALGIASILLVPSVLVMADEAEDWGRECALRPSNPDC